MEVLIIVILVGAVGLWLYFSGHKSGKHIGSKAAYKVGLRRGQRNSRRR